MHWCIGQAGLQDLPLESVDFSGSKQKSEGLAAFQQEAPGAGCALACGKNGDYMVIVW